MTLEEYREHHDIMLEKACPEPQEWITQIWKFTDYPTLNSVLQDELMVFYRDETQITTYLTSDILNEGIEHGGCWYDTDYIYNYLCYDINGDYIALEDVTDTTDKTLPIESEDVALIIDTDGYLQWITPAAMVKYKDIIEEY